MTTTIKEKPILFNSEMVKAVLDGRKTQTRRVMKNQPNYIGEEIKGVGTDYWDFDYAYVFDSGHIHTFDKNGVGGENWNTFQDNERFTEALHSAINQGFTTTPYGQIGDELWVRETHAIYQTVNHVVRHGGRSFSEVSDGQCAYKADGFETIDELKDHIRLMSDSSFENVEVKYDKWLPSIHMPRWASRIQLKVTDIRVERVQDISEEDSKAEGIGQKTFNCGELVGYKCYTSPVTYQSARQSFRTLWDSINKNRKNKYGSILPYSWSDNPWVWVVEFERVEK